MRLPVTLLRAAPGASLLVAAAVLAVAAALTAAPVWFGAAADATLPAMLAEVPPGQRGLEFEQATVIEEQPGDPLAGVAAAGDALTATLPASLRAVAGERIDMVDSQEYVAFNAPVNVTRVALRIQPSAAAGITLTAGVMPTAAHTTKAVENLIDATGQPVMATVIEVALSTTTAQVIGLTLGDELALLPGSGRYGATLIRVVGLFTVNDPSDTRWFSDASLGQPIANKVGMELTIYHAAALLAPDAYPLLLNSGGAIAGWGGGARTVPARYRWRFPVDTAAVARADTATLLADLARTQAANPYHSADTPGFASGLPQILEAFRLQRQTAGTAFALSILGPAAAGIGMLAVVAAALARRRRSSVTLLRARGAGRLRLVWTSAAATLLIVVPPAAAGSVAAAIALTGRPDAAVLPGVAVALVAALMVVGADVPALGARGSGRSAGGAGAGGAMSAGRRRVIDAFVIAVAVLGAVGLRTRATGAETTGTGVDLGTAGVPVLLALAGGIVVVRGFKLAVGGLTRLAARTRGLGAVHALRGLGRGSRGHDLALVVLVVAVAAGVFSSAVTATIADSQARAAADTVGADYRITSIVRVLPPNLNLGALRALGPLALGTETAGTLASPTIAGETVGVAALDAAAYAEVVRGSAVDPALADALTAAAAAAAGAPGAGPAAPTEAAPLRLALRADLAARTGITLGAVMTLRLGREPLPAVVAAITPILPGVPAADDVVMDLAALQAATGVAATPTLALLRAPASAADAVAQITAPYKAQLYVTDRAAMERELRAAPLVGVMRDGFLLALLLTSLFAAAVVMATASQVIALRTRENVLLGALGMAGRGTLGIAVAELGLTVLVALAAGVALGLAVAALTLPDLGLARFAGTDLAVRPAADPADVLGAVAGPAIAGLLAVLAIAITARPAVLAPRMLADEA